MDFGNMFASRQHLFLPHQSVDCQLHFAAYHFTVHTAATLVLTQVAKLAVEGPVHKIEVRRARCFKDSVAVFAGKGHAVWRQPLKVRHFGGRRGGYCIPLQEGGEGWRR
eukprot:scaffold40600_cov17-Tisochrysis_lutea.AAC.1